MPLDHFVGHVPISQSFEMPFEFEDLFRAWPIQIVFQLRTHRHRAVFDRALILVYGLSGAKILGSLAEPLDRFFRSEEQFNVLPQGGLIVFHRPHIVAPCFDNLQGQRALSKHRIASVDFAP